MNKNKNEVVEQSDKVVSITEAAKLNKVTRQAIYVAIKLSKLRASKTGTRWNIRLEDLADYCKHKYSRAKSVFQGELVFDNNQGYYSVNHIADMLNVPAQKIYYATRTNKLRAIRKGAAWVISVNDLNEYKEKFLQKKRNKRKAI